MYLLFMLGFPFRSVSKESACNAGDPGSIPGLGRSPGEGNGKYLAHILLRFCAYVYESHESLTSFFVVSLSGFIIRVTHTHKSLSCVRLFATPWVVAHQAPQSMGFSRHEYWSGLPFPSPYQS